jgi:hypothetical protein
MSENTYDIAFTDGTKGVTITMTFRLKPPRWWTLRGLVMGFGLWLVKLVAPVRVRVFPPGEDAMEVLAWKFARVTRGTDKLDAFAFGSACGELLAEMRDLDPNLYKAIVTAESPDWSKLGAR